MVNQKVIFTASATLSVMSIDELAMTSQVECVLDLSSDKVLSLSLDDTGMLVSVYLMSTGEAQKSIVRQTLRKKIFGSGWVLVN